MTRSKLVLPSGAMPWGRWIEENSDDTASAIARESSDVNSAGSVFAGSATIVQNQIRATPSVAAIYQRSIIPFSVTRNSNPNATGYVYESPVQTFNPPRPDRPYTYTVIADMSVSGTLMTFARSLVRVNDVDNMYQHENLQPGYETSGTFSIAGTGTIDGGDTVRAQMAVIASAPGTVRFDSASIWCIFTGSIL